MARWNYRLAQLWAGPRHASPYALTAPPSAGDAKATRTGHWSRWRA